MSPRHLTHRLQEIAMVVLGLVLAAVPLALWVAWSRTVFFVILAVCIASMTLVCILSLFEEGPDTGRQAHNRTPSRQSPDGELITDPHRHVPLVHGHRRPGDSRFAKTMTRLRDMFWRTGD